MIKNVRKFIKKQLRNSHRPINLQIRHDCRYSRSTCCDGHGSRFIYDDDNGGDHDDDDDDDAADDDDDDVDDDDDDDADDDENWPICIARNLKKPHGL